MPTQKPSERIEELFREISGDGSIGTVGYDVAIKAIIIYLDEAQEEKEEMK